MEDRALWLQLGSGIVDQAALGLGQLEVLEGREALAPEIRALRLARLRQALYGLVLLGREVLALAEGQESPVLVTLAGALEQGVRWLQCVDGRSARPLELGPVPAVTITVPPRAFARLLHCLTAALGGQARLEGMAEGDRVRLVFRPLQLQGFVLLDAGVLRPASALVARWGGSLEVGEATLGLLLPLGGGRG